jgi:plastocyanin
MRTGTIAALIAIAALAVPASAGAATTIKLGDNFFAPSSKTVGMGTKVLFKWIGNRRHNVTKKSGPGGAFKSRTTSADGVNFARVFNQRGTYRLICTIHPTEMRLSLTVR